MMDKKVVAVFDFDKTIISIDSGSRFYAWNIFKSKSKLFLVLLFAVLWIPFIVIPFTSNRTARILSWFSLLGLQRRYFRNKIRSFISSVHQAKGCVFYQEALDKIRSHRAEGHRVVIVSAAPSWLVRSFLADKGVKVDRIIASHCQYYWGGMKTTEHCYGENKVVMAVDHAEDLSTWRYGYSDSPSDVPMLLRCKHRYLINARGINKKRFERLLGSDVMFLNWG
jgi:phosphatidylglycerophosphatase C